MQFSLRLLKEKGADGMLEWMHDPDVNRVFDAPFAPLVLAEVEFETEAQANAFVAPEWFGEDVTFDGRYHNSYMSQLKF